MCHRQATQSPPRVWCATSIPGSPPTPTAWIFGLQASRFPSLSHFLKNTRQAAGLSIRTAIEDSTPRNGHIVRLHRCPNANAGKPDFAAPHGAAQLRKLLADPDPGIRSLASSGGNSLRQRRRSSCSSYITPPILLTPTCLPGRRLPHHSTWTGAMMPTTPSRSASRAKRTEYGPRTFQLFAERSRGRMAVRSVFTGMVEPHSGLPSHAYSPARRPLISTTRIRRMELSGLLSCRRRVRHHIRSRRSSAHPREEGRTPRPSAG